MALVDDHLPSRATLIDAVGAQGGEVVSEVSRVEDALRMVETYRPDVVISAVGLADGDGIEAARVMAAAACPVVLLTSHTDPAIAARAINAGVLGFLVKPLRAEELGPALDVAVCRSRELHAARRENERLRRDLESRKLIERAKGLLMKRLGLSEPEAFRKIQKTAMDSRRQMAEVAQALLLSEELARPRNGGR